MTAIDIRLDAHKPQIEYLDWLTTEYDGVEWELELSRETHDGIENLWVAAYRNGEFDGSASLTVANEFEEIGDLWLGQFPKLNAQVGRWAGEYL